MAELENKKRDVRYLNKDFDDFRRNLIDYAKIYFPDTYNDFNESSPGMMFIEMASYVGDVLSYYIDKQFKESLLSDAQERKNVVNLAQTLGYKPKTTVPASTNIDIFQTVPALTEDGGVTYNPDMRYALKIKEGMRVKSKTNSTTFRVMENIDFSFSSSIQPTDITIYEYSDNVPTYYLLKKQVRCTAGNIAVENISIGSVEKFKKINLSRNDITEIISVFDSNNNRWYEVPYLAQDTVFIEKANTTENDPELSQYSDTTPYLLKLKKVPRRFKTNILSDNITQLQFGSGISDSPDEEVIPNPTNVGAAIANSPTYLDTAFDPVNFLNTKTYGQIPKDTALTITYSYGGGVETNVPQDDLIELDFIQFSNTNDSVPSVSLLNDTKLSVATTNPSPAVGGKSAETLDEIRSNAVANFSAQQRAVTKEDYITRVYSLPAKYGNIAKCYIEKDSQLSQEDTTTSPTTIPNPLALNMYLLGYDANRQLVSLDSATKENIRTYLSQYRILTDSINLLNGYIVNISIDFEIIVLSNYNKNEVLLKSIEKLKDFFHIDKWQFNQPIIKSDIMYQLSLIEGVQNVTNLEFKNKTSTGYSNNYYNLDEAEPVDSKGNKGGIIYPSLDPMIWEVKYPDTDIRGRVR